MSIPTFNALDATFSQKTVNTTPNGGQASSDSSLPVVPSASGITAWTGSVMDMRTYGSIVINCAVAPTTPWTIQTDDVINPAITTTAIANTATGITTTTTIAAAGRYLIPGNCRVSLTGGTGGTFSIMGTN